MPNVAQVLKDEIQRLARKQVRAEVLPLKRDNARLKRSVADLRRQVITLTRWSCELARKVTPVMAAKETEAATEKAARLRPTAKGIKKLRTRLGLSQVQFGKLVGVSGQSIVLWENSDRGRLRMRGTTLAALAAILRIGKREARKRLEQLGEPKPAPKPRHRK